MDELRQTGRTTRVLKEAIETALTGKNVLVYVANATHLAMVHRQAIAELSDYAIKVTASKITLEQGSLEFRTFNRNRFDEETRGRRVKALFDHFVLENSDHRFSRTN